MVPISPGGRGRWVLSHGVSVCSGERLVKSEVRPSRGLSFWGDGVVAKRTSTTGLCK